MYTGRFVHFPWALLFFWCVSAYTLVFSFSFSFRRNVVQHCYALGLSIYSFVWFGAHFLCYMLYKTRSCFGRQISAARVGTEWHTVGIEWHTVSIECHTVVLSGTPSILSGTQSYWVAQVGIEWHTVILSDTQSYWVAQFGIEWHTVVLSDTQSYWVAHSRTQESLWIHVTMVAVSGLLYRGGLCPYCRVPAVGNMPLILVLSPAIPCSVRVHCPSLTDSE